MLCVPVELSQYGNSRWTTYAMRATAETRTDALRAYKLDTATHIYRNEDPIIDHYFASTQRAHDDQ